MLSNTEIYLVLLTVNIFFFQTNRTLGPYATEQT